MSRLTSTLTVLALAAGMMSAAHAQEKMTFKVIGQPMASGLIAKNLEKPFFENFAAKTGLPINADYKPMDTVGIKDTEQLRVMKANLFDIISLRMSVNARDEPTMIGLDLVGASPDYATFRKVVAAYYDTLDQRLQKQFNAKMLAVWPFGPQILFCNKPIAKLADVKGLKVRVFDQNMAKFIETMGGTPVPISFADTHQALSLGVVDCGITGPSSANSAGWPEVTTHQLPLGFKMEPNIYTISLKAWNSLKPDQQVKLQTAITTLNEEIWTYSEELFQDAVNCNTGKEPCKTGKKYKLVNVPVTAADVALVRGAVSKVSLPSWAEVCNKSNPTCSQTWSAKVGGTVLGLK